MIKGTPLKNKIMVSLRNVNIFSNIFFLLLGTGHMIIADLPAIIKEEIIDQTTLNVPYLYPYDHPAVQQQ